MHLSTLITRLNENNMLNVTDFNAATLGSLICTVERYGNFVVQRDGTVQDGTSLVEGAGMEWLAEVVEEVYNRVWQKDLPYEVHIKGVKLTYGPVRIGDLAPFMKAHL